jgi:hypothetical protein
MTAFSATICHDPVFVHHWYTPNRARMSLFDPSLPRAGNQGSPGIVCNWRHRAMSRAQQKRPDTVDVEASHQPGEKLFHHFECSSRSRIRKDPVALHPIHDPEVPGAWITLLADLERVELRGGSPGFSKQVAKVVDIGTRRKSLERGERIAGDHGRGLRSVGHGSGSIASTWSTSTMGSCALRLIRYIGLIT